MLLLVVMMMVFCSYRLGNWLQRPKLPILPPVDNDDDDVGVVEVVVAVAVKMMMTWFIHLHARSQSPQQPSQRCPPSFITQEIIRSMQDHHLIRDKSYKSRVKAVAGEMHPVINSASVPQALVLKRCFHAHFSVTRHKSHVTNRMPGQKSHVTFQPSLKRQFWQ